MDKNISNIKDRVLQIAKNKSISYEKFFGDLGVSYANFKGRQKESALGSNVLEKIISKYPEISPVWLLTGKGPMTTSNIPQPSDIPLATPSPMGDQGIPLLPVSAMAGALSGDVSVLEYECERYVVPAFQGADFLIPVKGSSMYPKYSSGDIVACKRVPASDLFFQWNKVYVLDTDQGPLIKRIRRGSSDDTVLIVSDNTAYEPFELRRDQIRGIALVIGAIRLE